MNDCPYPLAAALGLAVLFSPTQARAIEPEAEPEGVEVLTRGPVHEAFAGPVSQAPVPSAVAPQSPPEPVPELPPEVKPEGDNVHWVPGYWNWDDDRQEFIWVSGFWRVPPPGRHWVPGHWHKVEGGWQWVPGFWGDPGQSQLDYLPPPPPPLASVPASPAPSANCFFAPGCWVYRDNRYLWRPGAWVDHRPGCVWVPAHYNWTPCGYLFVNGYWDHALARRGLLFAPVGVTRRAYPADWCYVPRFVVRPDFLLGALFVRPATCHYYFGDYFAARYARAGFVPWIDFRIGKDQHDPLFAHHRHSQGAGWEREVRALYADRFSGRAPAPPRTLAQQTTLVQKVVNPEAGRNNIRTVTVLAPLAQAEKLAGVKLRSVSRDARQQEQKLAERARETARARARQEAQLAAKGPPPARPSDPPRTVKLDLPRPAPAGKPSPEPPRSDKPAVRAEKADRAGKPVPARPAPPRTEATPPPAPSEALRRNLSPPPAGTNTGPAKSAPSPPKKETPAPRKEPASPAPPKKEAAPSPARPATPSPRPVTVPQGREAAARKEVAPPSKQATPPPPKPAAASSRQHSPQPAVKPSAPPATRPAAPTPAPRRLVSPAPAQRGNSPPARAERPSARPSRNRPSR